ncbi:MAG: hypothetical protein C1943_18625 [Halochromatium sp.]|nr:hypothetical protein [Halochromatium sp.]
MTFLERFADPLLTGQVYNAKDFVAAMQGMGFNAVIGVGKDEEVKAVTQSAAGEFQRVENALLARIQRLILGQTLTSNVGDSGSYAAAKVHNEVRDDKRRADLRLVTNTAQTLVDALWRLNAFSGELPTLYLQDDTGLEAERAERDAKLVQAGVLKLTEQYLLSKYDYVEADFEIPTAPASPLAAASMAAPLIGAAGQGASLPSTLETTNGEPAHSIHLVANGQRFSADQELVEDLVDNALSQAASPIPAEQIAKAIRNAKDPGDLAERLAKLYIGSDAAEFRDLSMIAHMEPLGDRDKGATL